MYEKAENKNRDERSRFKKKILYTKSIVASVGLEPVH